MAATTSPYRMTRRDNHDDRRYFPPLINNTDGTAGVLKLIKKAQQQQQ
jgi:hypothetical protein